MQKFQSFHAAKRQSFYFFSVTFSKNPDPERKGMSQNRRHAGEHAVERNDFDVFKLHFSDHINEWNCLSCSHY